MEGIALHGRGWLPIEYHCKAPRLALFVIALVVAGSSTVVGSCGVTLKCRGRLAHGSACLAWGDLSLAVASGVAQLTTAVARTIVFTLEMRTCHRCQEALRFAIGSRKRDVRYNCCKLSGPLKDAHRGNGRIQVVEQTSLLLLEVLEVAREPVHNQCRKTPLHLRSDSMSSVRRILIKHGRVLYEVSRALCESVEVFAVGEFEKLQLVERVVVEFLASSVASHDVLLEEIDDTHEVPL